MRQPLISLLEVFSAFQEADCGRKGKKKKYIVSSGSILSLNLFLAFQLRVK